MQFQSLGSASSILWKKNKCHILDTNGKQLFIEFFSDNIVRICAFKKSYHNHSYAVCAKPKNNEIDFDETDTILHFKTRCFKLDVSKNPLRFAMLDLDDNEINADEPAFGIGWIGDEVTCYKSLHKDEKFIGLGEKTGRLNRRGNAYEHWNTDFFAYPEDGDPLYMTTPFYIGAHNGKCYGIFFDNTHRTRFNFGASNHRFSSFSAEAGAMNYYFIYGENVEEIIKEYTWLTGRMELPPLWSLGFQQCRYSYYPDTEVLQIANTFRDRKIPCDVIYLDIHYMQDYKVFTWNNERFSEPEKLINTLLKDGFKVVIIVDPGVKQEDSYWVYESGKKENVFIQYPDGTEYAADVWPGTCAFPDYTKEKTRAWWGSLYKNHIEEGIAGFWNDMNEPASWGQDTPNLIGFDFDGNNTTHKEGRNVYGMQMARSTFEGVKKLSPDKRPFVLTRSGYSGIQRYAAAWTGDNTATDEHMLLGVRLVNSLGLTGVANSGYDIGGFCGEASPALFARWISIAAFSPFFRAHSMVNTRSAEPWTFGEQVEEIARNYINLRYRLLPTLYTLFFESSKYGVPVQRSLAVDFTFDENIYAFDNQFLMGKGLLVCPTDSRQEIAKCYLPDKQSNWYFFYNDTVYKGSKEVYVDAPMERLPVFIKEGTFLFSQSVIQHTSELPETTLEVHFYYSEKNSEALYYEDAGDGFGYLNNDYLKLKFKWKANETQILIEEKEGDFNSKFKTLRIYLHGFSKDMINGMNQDISFKEYYRWIEPISNFDPFFMPETNVNQIQSLAYFEVEV